MVLHVVTNYYGLLLLHSVDVIQFNYDVFYCFQHNVIDIVIVVTSYFPILVLLHQIGNWFLID